MYYDNKFDANRYNPNDQSMTNYQYYPNYPMYDMNNVNNYYEAYDMNNLNQMQGADEMYQTSPYDINMYDDMREANEEVLEMLEEAMKDEKKAIRHYKKLRSMLSGDDKQVVESIAMDESKHYKLFKDIYYKLTGKRYEVEDKERSMSSDPVKVIKESIFDELEAVEFYRKIMFLLHGIEFKNMLYEIITDEQEHATKLTYLYAKLK